MERRLVPEYILLVEYLSIHDPITYLSLDNLYATEMYCSQFWGVSDQMVSSEGALSHRQHISLCTQMAEGPYKLPWASFRRD